VSTEIRISAKNLGELAMPNFCPRCFWLKLKLNNRLPFQIFPGIFSSIDSYTKQIVHGYFDCNDCFPRWLEGLGELTGYKEPPHYSMFRITDKASGVSLWGTPDGIFIRPDNSYIIVDYKTAKYTGNQDNLMPMYQVQLNAYALIGEVSDLVRPVSDLALIYMEPVTHRNAAIDASNHRYNGFAMGFIASIHKIPLDMSMVPLLLAKTREIYELSQAPSGCTGCKECLLLDDMIAVLNGRGYE
jgi:hypothetical protein